MGGLVLEPNPKLDKSPNVSVIIGKEVKHFPADWERDVIYEKYSDGKPPNLCSQDLVNRFFRTRNAYNDSGYLACDRDFKLVEYDRLARVEESKQKIKVDCNERTG